MPSREREIPVVLRRIEGVNQAIDPAFLGPSYVRRLQNFIPDPALILTKRSGTSSYQNLGGNDRCDWLHRCYTTTGDRILLAVQIRSPGVQISVNDGAFAAITNNTFSTNDLRYSMAELGGFVYVGNGTDPIKQVPISTTPTALDLSALGTFTDTSGTPSTAADTASTLLSGLYSYRWVVYNSSTKRWVTSGGSRTYRLSAAGGTQITFTSPAGGDYTLGANELFHLFVGPPDLPIEFATDQSPEGIGQAATVTIRDINIDGAPVPLHGAVRSGSMLAAHLNQIYFAGWATDPHRVFSTAPLTLGREQAIFDLGAFFPHNAASPRFPTPVTGIGVVDVSTGDNPRSPLAIFTMSRPFLLYGRLYNDPTAELVELGIDAGCISHATIRRTSIGLVYCGTRTVWCIPPGGGQPVDIGWPIEPRIRAIPRGVRSLALAFFHKGFYKLAVAPPGGSANTEEWWLDLRRGLGSVPSWSGPHTGVSPTAATTGSEDSAEDDRGFVAITGTPARVLLVQQSGIYTDNAATIVSEIQSGTIDNGDPFGRKIWTGVRANGRVSAPTSMSVQFVADNGLPASFDPLVFDAPVGAIWDSSAWNLGAWATTAFLEGDSQASESRPEGVSGDVVLTHNAATAIDLRDLEVRYIPKVRPVAPERRITS